MNAAERKRRQREREQRLGMQRFEMRLAEGERALIAANARARGYVDHTEYLISLAIDDGFRLRRDRSQHAEMQPKGKEE